MLMYIAGEILITQGSKCGQGNGRVPDLEIFAPLKFSIFMHSAREIVRTLSYILVMREWHFELRWLYLLCHDSETTKMTTMQF